MDNIFLLYASIFWHSFIVCSNLNDCWYIIMQLMHNITKPINKICGDSPWRDTSRLQLTGSWPQMTWYSWLSHIPSPAQVTSPTHKLHFISSHRKTYFHIFCSFYFDIFCTFLISGSLFSSQTRLHSHWPIDCIKWFYFKNSFKRSNW